MLSWVSFVGRDLDQLDPALAPAAGRLDPVARAQVIEGLEVLVVLEDAVALHQAEAARIVVEEGRDPSSGAGCAAAARSTRRRRCASAGRRNRAARAGSRRSRRRSFSPSKNIEVSGARPTDGDGPAREQRHRDVERGLGRRVDLEAVGARRPTGRRAARRRWPGRRPAAGISTQNSRKYGNSSGSPLARH